MYAVECTTDGGNTWVAMRIDAHTAINLNEFVMQFLPDFQTSVRITECDCDPCIKVFSEEDASVWIAKTLGIKVYYTISGKENIFHFSLRHHAEEIAALLRERGQSRYDVVMVRC